MKVKPTYEELERRVQELEKIESDHKCSKEALRESKNLFKMLYEKAPLGYQSLDENGHFMVVNQTWLDTLEYTKEEVIGKSFADFLHPGWRDHFNENFPRFKSIGEVLGVEFEMVKKNGDLILVSFTGKISRDKKGDFQQTHCIFHDITERKRHEDELRMARELSARIIEDGPMAITLLDRDGKIVFANRHAERLFSLEKSKIEALGYNSSEWLIVDVDGSPFPDKRLPFRQVMSTGQAVYNVQHAITRPDAARKILSINGAPLHDEQGRIDRVVFVILDITKRKQAEEALRESEEKFRALFEKGPIGVAFHEMVYDDCGNAIDYRFLDANSSYLELTGVDPRGKCATEAFPGIENDPFDWIGTFGRVAKTGEQIRFEQYLQPNKRWYDCVGYQFKPDYFVAAFVDITERKHAEQSLVESETRFKALHNASFGGIAIHDQGTILECNQGLVEMTGYEYTELIGMNGLLLIAEKSREAVMNNIQTGYEKLYEAFGLRKNGEEFPIQLEARKVPYKGEQVRTVEFRDITERKRAEKEYEKLQVQLNQAQKMESVGRLAGGVAHDFNNMLGIIIGHTDMILEQMDPDQPFHADITEIRNAGERSADLTRQLLAFARKQTVAPTVLDLNDTVEGMLRLLRRLIGEDIDLAWRPGQKVWPVKIDPAQINQVLANLCVNARDAIAGVGKITIETGNTVFDEAYCKDHAGFVPGEYTMLAVSDNGCGMDSETLPHLFEPFFTTKELGKGTGLGLAMVYGAVKQNNGFVNVYSEPGQVTTFKIYLPRHAAKADRQSEKGPDKPGEQGHETVLLVEDELAILEMTTRMLERLGYTVLAAGTPGEAVRLAGEHPGRIDLLLTDVVMPEMNGRDLAKKLLSICPDIRRLFMSGYTANVIAHHSVLDKGVHFIQKPFSMKDLGGKLREALEG